MAELCAPQAGAYSRPINRHGGSAGVANIEQQQTSKTRRGAATRQALLDAGRRLFAEHSADAVAVDDIVSAASVAKGSFYNHFPDKEALVTAVVGEIREGIESEITTINAGIDDPASRIVRAICVYAGRVTRTPQDGKILIRNDPRGAGVRKLNEGLERDLEAGLRRGRLLLPNIKAGLYFVIGVANGVLLRSVREHDRNSAVSHTQEVCMLMLRGFGLSGAEAELISAQAADDVLRKRFDDGTEID